MTHVLRKISNKHAENSSFAERLCPRKKVPNHTPKLPRFRDSSHRNACNTSATVSPSRNAEQRLAKMQLPSTPNSWPSVCTKNERSGRRSGNGVRRRCERTPRLDQRDSIRILVERMRIMQGVLTYSILHRRAAWGSEDSIGYLSCDRCPKQSY